MTAPLRVAVIGAGYFSQFHYDAWSRCPEAELVGLTDPQADRAAAMAERFAVPLIADNLDQLISDGQPDLIDIVTPPDTHLAIVARIAQAGIPMVCQKPLAPDLKDARKLVDLAGAAEVPLIVHENFRFQPWHRHAKVLLETGALGAPHGITFRLRPGDGQGARAYLDRQPYFQTMKRFLIHETGIHFVDVFRALLGEVSAVTARLQRRNPAIAGEDSGQVLLEFENGTTALLDANRLNDHSAENCRLTMGEMWLEGSAGILRLDGDGGLWFKPHGKSERPEPYDWSPQGFAGDCVFALSREICRHLLEQAPLPNTGRAYLRNIEIEEAIYRSHESGRRVELPVQPHRPPEVEVPK